MPNGRIPVPDPESAKDLMNQLSNLRQRLEGEQRKVTNQLKRGQEQYSRLQDVAQQRKAAKSQQKKKEIFDRVLQKGSNGSGASPPPSDRLARFDMSNGSSSDAAPADLMAEFNALKYKDLSSGAAKKEMLESFPEPPNSLDTLDAQQRALMHEQQRELERLKMALGAVSQLATRDQEQSSVRPSSPGALSSLSVGSLSSFNVDAITRRNEERLRKLAASSANDTSGDPEAVLREFLARGNTNLSAADFAGGMATIPESSDGVSLMADTSFRPASP